jgi:hypothetical protein
MKSNNIRFFILFVVVLILVACSSGDGGETALTVNGNVASEQAWTEDQIKAMETIEVESTNKDGETKSYSGVLITDLLAEAQPNAAADTLVFVADDGYEAEMPLEELMACSNCIVSFRNQGGFSTILPEYSSKLQVKGVIEIQVK